MPLTSAQRVRQRIQDEPRRADAVYRGDGTATQFSLPHNNITSGSAFVPAAAGWSATGAAFDTSGFVTFSNVVSANSAFRLVYVHSVFSDAVIDEYVSAYGQAAALQCAYDLLFDATKRARWAAGETSYDDTEARHVLRDIISALKAELQEGALGVGEVMGWDNL